LWLTYNRDCHHSLRFVAVVRYRQGKRNSFLSTQPTPNKLSAELLQVLRENKPSQRFAVGALLFQEGTPATGIFLVETGEVQILLPTGHRERQLLEVAGPGTLLGLSEAMNGERKRITAIAGDGTTVISTSREEFLGHLQRRGDFSLEIARMLSEDLHVLYHKFKSVCAHLGRPRHRALRRTAELGAAFSCQPSVPNPCHWL
jgi:CRP-like cAMP-binding protein